MTAPSQAGWPHEPERPLEDRLIRFLAAEPRRVAFSGLRRALGAHPETLTRLLRRLERGGILTRTENGYALADGYHRAVGRPSQRTFRPVASVELAEGVTAEHVLGSLAGRWFGRLRWVGIYEREEDPWLVWSVDGASGHVLLSVHGRTMRVGVEGVPLAPTEVLEESARELLVRGLSKLPRRVEPALGPRALRAGPSWVGWAA